MPRKKVSEKSARETFELYFVLVHDWEVSYFFGVNPDKESYEYEGPQSEILFLELGGEFLEPTKIQGRHVTVSLSASRHLDQEMADPKLLKSNPGSIGYIHVRGQVGNIVLFLPFLAFASITTMLQAGKCQGIFLGGNRLRYGKASIRQFGLLGEKALQEEMAEPAWGTESPIV